MIWNPWKQNRILREQLDLYINMAMEEGQKAVFLQSDKEVLQGRIDALHAELERNSLIHTERLDGYKQLLTSTTEGRSHLFDVLLAIIKEEKPTSNAMVKRICQMAREALG
jgi:hypothetical protein